MSLKTIIIIRNAASYDFGGGERFPVFLANSLQRQSLNPIIVSRSQKLLEFAKINNIRTIRGWWWQKQNWSGVHALLFPMYFIWQCILFTWYISLFITKKPSIIHIQSKDDFIAATIAGRVLNKRIVWTDHADLKHVWKNLTVWYKNPVGKLVYFAARYADTITLVSNSELKLVSNTLPKHSYLKDKLHVVYNGVVDTALDHETKQKNDLFTYCVASRLVTDKGIMEAIEAFSKLSKDYKNIKLLLIGDGPEAKKFKKIAEDTQNITFLGYQTNPLHYIANADVFLHPTYHEGFSVALVEASMLKKPIIATSVGGNVEIIHNHDTGLLIPAKNISALYDAMKFMYENSEMRHVFAANARAQYERKFQFDIIVKKEFMRFYNGSST